MVEGCTFSNICVSSRNLINLTDESGLICHDKIIIRLRTGHVLRAFITQPESSINMRETSLKKKKKLRTVKHPHLHYLVCIKNYRDSKKHYKNIFSFICRSTLQPSGWR